MAENIEIDLVKRDYLYHFVASYFIDEIWEDKELQKYLFIGKKGLQDEIEIEKTAISTKYFEYAVYFKYFDSLEFNGYEDWYKCSERLIKTILDDYGLNEPIKDNEIKTIEGLNPLFKLFKMDIQNSLKKGFEHIVIYHEDYFQIKERYNFLLVLEDITLFVCELMRLKLHQLILTFEFQENNKLKESKDKKKLEVFKTPTIQNTEQIDILYDRLLKMNLINCKKTEYNKLFNGSRCKELNIEWSGTIGLLKILFMELSILHNFENKLYYRQCFNQFTKEQYNNNKPSSKDIKTATELLS